VTAVVDFVSVVRVVVCVVFLLKFIAALFATKINTESFNFVGVAYPFAAAVAVYPIKDDFSFFELLWLLSTLLSGILVVLFAVTLVALLFSLAIHLPGVIAGVIDGEGKDG